MLGDTGIAALDAAFFGPCGDAALSVLPNLTAKLRYSLAATLFDVVQEFGRVAELPVRLAIVFRAGELSIPSNVNITNTERDLTTRRCAVVRAALKPPRICLYAALRSWSNTTPLTIAEDHER
jgi:hypothetical protein